MIFEPLASSCVTSRIVKDAARRERWGHSASEQNGRVIPFPEAGGSGLDDAAIVRILLAGDPRAARVVWNRLAPMVRGMLLRSFGPEHDIDDLIQEVFLTLFKRVATLREPQALRAFVIAITAHTIRREVRRKIATRWLQLGTTHGAVARDADLDSREALVRLYRILDRLGAEERTAFSLRFFEGLEIVQVARALGISAATTKRRIGHAWTRIVTHAKRDAALVEYLSSYSPEGAP